MSRRDPEEDDNDDIPKVTEEELASVAYGRPEITLSSSGHSQLKMTFKAPSGQQHFSVRDLLDAICEFEAEDRVQYDWFGGIDVHHVFYEGMTQKSDGSWTAWWGS